MLINCWYIHFLNSHLLGLGAAATVLVLTNADLIVFAGFLFVEELEDAFVSFIGCELLVFFAWPAELFTGGWGLLILPVLFALFFTLNEAPFTFGIENKVITTIN